MLVIGDDQHARLPVRRVADRLVGLLDQPLARGDARRSDAGSCRCRNRASIVSPIPSKYFGSMWMKPASKSGILEVLREMFVEIAHVEGVAHALELAHDREIVAGVDARFDVGVVQRVEDVPTLEIDTAELIRARLDQFRRRRRFVVVGARRGMQEVAIGLGRARASSRTSDRRPRIPAPASSGSADAPGRSSA